MVAKGQKKGNSMSGLPKIETPVFNVELPSDKEKSVTMRVMKVKEEKILLMAKQSNDPMEVLAAIKQVVNNCMVNENVSVNDIALFDLEYLFLKLRAQSVNDIAEVAYLDNEEVADHIKQNTKEDEQPTEELMEEARRKATRTFKIDLRKVKVQFPKESDRRVPINDKTGIVLKYPPAELYGDKEFIESKPEDVLDILISKSIDYIYEGENITHMDKVNLDEIKEWLDNLDVKTHNKLIEFFSELPHLHYEIKYKNKLGSERKIELTTLNDFFQFA
jgi:hypothetical protein